MFHEELLDPRVESTFRGSFIKLFRKQMSSGGLSEENLLEYFRSQEFRELNEWCNGLGYHYVGLTIHKLLDAHKIRFENGRYVNGSGAGIDSSSAIDLTSKEREAMVRLLEPGIRAPSVSIQGEEGS